MRRQLAHYPLLFVLLLGWESATLSDGTKDTVMPTDGDTTSSAAATTSTRPRSCARDADGDGYSTSEDCNDNNIKNYGL